MSTFPVYRGFHKREMNCDDSWQIEDEKFRNLHESRQVYKQMQVFWLKAPHIFAEPI